MFIMDLNKKAIKCLSVEHGQKMREFLITNGIDVCNLDFCSIGDHYHILNNRIGAINSLKQGYTEFFLPEDFKNGDRVEVSDHSNFADSIEAIFIGYNPKNDRYKYVVIKEIGEAQYTEMFSYCRKYVHDFTDELRDLVFRIDQTGQEFSYKYKKPNQ